MILLVSRVTLAHPPPEPPDTVEWREDRAFFEWSTWIRLGFGVAAERPTSEPSIARTTTPPPAMNQHTTWEGALGVDLTLPVPTGRTRLGPWLELRPDGLYAGAELLLAARPAELHMFWYEGEGVWSLRGGGNMDHATGAIAYGYRCPWKLWGPYDTRTRYEIGVRLVASYTRAVSEPQDWSMSFGIEFEPIGSLRYVAGIQSWY